MRGTCRPSAVTAGILAGEDQQHAGRRLGLARIERDDARMRMRRAQEIAASDAGKPYVVNIAALSAQQVRVFFTRDWLPDTELPHRIPSK